MCLCRHPWEGHLCEKDVNSAHPSGHPTRVWRLATHRYRLARGSCRRRALPHRDALAALPALLAGIRHRLPLRRCGHRVQRE